MALPSSPSILFLIQVMERAEAGTSPRKEREYLACLHRHHRGLDLPLSLLAESSALSFEHKFANPHFQNAGHIYQVKLCMTCKQKSEEFLQRCGWEGTCGMTHKSFQRFLHSHFDHSKSRLLSLHGSALKRQNSAFDWLVGTFLSFFFESNPHTSTAGILPIEISVDCRMAR